jgi:hypothetical protein
VERVALLDVDNTLLDNDRLKDDLERALRTVLHPADAERFWDLYEQVRRDLGMVSFPAVLERFLPTHCRSPLAPEVAAEALFGIDFSHYLRPGALALVERIRRSATPVILSNGDQFFQRWKIWKSGLARAVDHRVWVFPEKEHHFGDLDRAFPQARFMLVEDKLDALQAARAHWGERVINVWMRFGHYADDATGSRVVDLTAESPAELIGFVDEVWGR